MKQSLLVLLVLTTAPTLVAAGPIDLSHVGNGQMSLTDSRSLTVRDMPWHWNQASTAAWLPYPTEFTGSTAISASVSSGLQQDLWGEVPMDLLNDLTMVHGAALTIGSWGRGRTPKLNDRFCDRLGDVAPLLARRLGCGGGQSGQPSNPVPEPATLLLLGTGLAGMAIRQRMRRA